jgi:hypothetical protein
MKLIDKLKNVFFEEVPEDEDEEELPQTFAKKIEPKKPVEPVVHEMKREEKPIIVEDEEEVQIEEEPEEEEKKEESTFPMMFDDDDFLEDTKIKEEDDYTPPVTYHREEKPERELYQGKKELSYIESVRKPNYSYTKSYYEEKETKGFKPSPIISPVYGVLDKNYRKEEVVTKKEIKLSTGKTNFDLDTVRNKAFGKEDVEISDKKTREAKMEEAEDKKIYDVNNNKPQVNRVTLADADEYYNDLGLAYNVDYSDASRNTGTRTSKYNNNNNKRDKKEKDVDDNLFDLIDSMYNKED